MTSATDTDSTTDTRTGYDSCYYRKFKENPSWVEKEKKRLSNILEYNLEGFDIEDKGLNAITRLAAMICGTPMAFITLVGDSYVNFLARTGCPLSGTVRLNSFCDLAIEGSDFFEITDTLKDPRFEENILVKGQQTPLRYYGGYPVFSPQGHKFGSLCVVDLNPYKLTDMQKEAIKILAEEVMVHLELRRNNKELKAANEKIERLAKVKEDFMNNVSHELRTPLNAIGGYGEILSKTELNTDQKEAVSIIKGSCEILIVLINDILDFSKINSGKLQLENIPFDLRKTMKNIKDLLTPKAKEKDLKFELKIDEKIPKFILGDKVRINQIIMNLTGNAVKFTQKGFVKIDIQMLEETDKSIKINFSVKDSGIGIHADKLSSIFERFEQAGKDITRKFGGTGLGLNISKNLVELHNSNLQLKSVYGEGTEFYFTIKFNKFIDKNDLKSANNSKAGADNENIIQKISNMKTINLLVCEDNLVNIKLIKAIFKNKNINIEIAQNGKIAIDMLKKKTYNFDIILMDIQMPEMNGFETTKYIRNIMNLNIPIIGFSASTSEIEKNYCIEIGMNDYILKTFGTNDIFDNLTNFINTNKIYKEDIDDNTNVNKNNLSYCDHYENKKKNSNSIHKVKEGEEKSQKSLGSAINRSIKDLNDSEIKKLFQQNKKATTLVMDTAKTRNLFFAINNRKKKGKKKLNNNNNNLKNLQNENLQENANQIISDNQKENQTVAISESILPKSDFNLNKNLKNKNANNRNDGFFYSFKSNNHNILETEKLKNYSNLNINNHDLAYNFNHSEENLVDHDASGNKNHQCVKSFSMISNNSRPNSLNYTQKNFYPKDYVSYSSDKLAKLSCSEYSRSNKIVLKSSRNTPSENSKEDEEVANKANFYDQCHSSKSESFKKKMWQKKNNSIDNINLQAVKKSLMKKITSHYNTDNENELSFKDDDKASFNNDQRNKYVKSKYYQLYSLESSLNESMNNYENNYNDYKNKNYQNQHKPNNPNFYKFSKFNDNIANNNPNIQKIFSNSDHIINNENREEEHVLLNCSSSSNSNLNIIHLDDNRSVHSKKSEKIRQQECQIFLSPKKSNKELFNFGLGNNNNQEKNLNNNDPTIKASQKSSCLIPDTNNIENKPKINNYNSHDTCSNRNKACLNNNCCQGIEFKDKKNDNNNNHPIKNNDNNQLRKNQENNSFGCNLNSNADNRPCELKKEKEDSDNHKGLSRRPSFSNVQEKKLKENESLDFSHLSIKFENFEDESENEDLLNLENANNIYDFDDDPEMRNELLEIFLEENPKQMRSLKSAIVGRNLEAIKFVAHTMKPSALMFGLKRMYKKLEKIETIVKGISLTKIKILYDDIKKNLEIFYKENGKA